MIKHICVAVLLSSIPFSAFAKGSYSSGSHAHYSGGNHSIRAYTKSNGTYVAPSHATNPNHTKANNYSTKGNVNPFTGKAGTKKLYVLLLLIIIC